MQAGHTDGRKKKTTQRLAVGFNPPRLLFKALTDLFLQSNYDIVASVDVQARSDKTKLST